MSEYQYYEFQAVDRSLPYEEQQAVAALSSRVEPHPRQAVFVYHWGGFRGNPEAILRKYYDATLYMANWGSRQLMSRFPRGILDLESANAYCQLLIAQDYLSFSAEGDHRILNVEFHDEEAAGWAEGEGRLPAMLSLHDDILCGDYRTLCLARHQGEEVAFQARINHLYEKYNRRSSLIRRMRNVGLYEL